MIYDIDYDMTYDIIVHDCDIIVHHIPMISYMIRTMAAHLAKLAQGESGVLANLVRTAWVQFLPPPARSMLRAFHQAVCLPLLRFQ